MEGPQRGRDASGISASWVVVSAGSPVWGVRGGAQRSPDTCGRGADAGSGQVAVSPTLGTTCAGHRWLPAQAAVAGEGRERSPVHGLLEPAGRGEADTNVALVASPEDHPSAAHLGPGLPGEQPTAAVRVLWLIVAKLMLWAVTQRRC